jgi:hypothetical protein
MPGEFTLTGAAWKLVADGDDGGSEEDLEALTTMTEGKFICNIPPNVAVPIPGGVMFVDTRPFTVLDDGQISEDGSTAGLTLLANDPDNGIEGVQWTIRPGKVLIGGRVRSLRSWTFDAPGPGDEISLENLTPTASVDPGGGGGGGGGTPDNGSVTFPKFAATAIVTTIETIAANDNDITIPTSAAVKAYADSVGGGGGGGDIDGGSPSGTGGTGDIDGGTP